MSETMRGARSEGLHVASFAKGLRVMQAFGEGVSDLSLSEIARRAGLDKSAAQRFVATLHGEGFLLRDPRTRRYRPSLAFLELGYAYLWSDPLVRVAAPRLIELSRRLGETVNLSEPSGCDIVYVARIPTQRTHFAATFVGRRAPALNTSSGRAMIATLPEAARAEAVATWPLRRYTPLTTLDRDLIARRVQEARERGYSVSHDELIRNEVGVAAAILDVHGAPVAAVHCSVSALSWAPERISADLVPPLLETVNALSPALTDPVEAP